MGPKFNKESIYSRGGYRKGSALIFPPFSSLPQSPQFSPKLHRRKRTNSTKAGIFHRFFFFCSAPPSLFDNCNLSQLHYSLHFHYGRHCEESNDLSGDKWLWLWRFSFWGLAGIRKQKKKKRMLKYQTKYTISGIRLILTRLSPQGDWKQCWLRGFFKIADTASLWWSRALALYCFWNIWACPWRFTISDADIHMQWSVRSPISIPTGVSDDKILWFFNFFLRHFRPSVENCSYYRATPAKPQLTWFQKLWAKILVFVHT